MEMQDARGRAIKVDDIVRLADGRLLQVKGFANVRPDAGRGVHVAASETELVTAAQIEMAAPTPGEMTILWGLEPPAPPPPNE